MECMKGGSRFKESKGRRNIAIIQMRKLALFKVIVRRLKRSIKRA
jgi:hypothetical protein